MILLLAALGSLQTVEDAERRLAAVRAEARPDGGAAAEAWERRLFEAQWDLGRVLFRAAEEANDRAAWRRVADQFTDLVWRNDDTLGGLEARLPLARAHQALGEWPACWSHLGAARRLETPERRKDPDLVDVAVRSMTLELRARAAHGRDHEISLQSARGMLKQFADRAETPPFARLRIEVGRCLAAAGKTADAVAAIEAVRALGGETVDDALEALAALSPARALEFAERLFERRHFGEAVGRFLRVQPRTPRAWLRIGQCYLHLGRLHEAAAALPSACAAGAPDRFEAALALEKTLARLARLGETGVAPRLESHRAWMRATWPLEKAAPEVLRAQADALLRNGNFKDAAELYGKIDDAEAARSRGYCRFRLKDYEGAAADLRRALAASPGTAGSTADLAAWSLLHLNRPAEVLQLTEGLRQLDPVLAEWRLAHRVDAFARLRRFDDARAELARMSESVSATPTIRALERLAAGYEAADDPALRGAHARVVVALSEKSLRPLRGPRLLAAADALAHEGGKEAGAMAFDLYSRYLAEGTPPEAERRAVEYSRARAALSAGDFVRAREIAGALCAVDTTHGAFLELLADVKAEHAASLPRGPERGRLLDDATAAYGELAARLGSHAEDAAWFRVIAKYAAGLAERDPGRARRFFAVMEKRGYGDWDGDRAGVRTKMRALQAQLSK